MDNSWLSDLPGIKDLALGDNAPLPRRDLLNVRGAGVSLTDNPALGETQLNIPITPSGQTDTYSLADLITVDYRPPGSTGIDVTRLTLLRLNPLANISFTGLVATLRPRLVIANVASAFNLNIRHESGNSTDVCRFTCPALASYTLLPGRCVEIVRDSISQRWRVVL